MQTVLILIGVLIAAIILSVKFLEVFFNRSQTLAVTRTNTPSVFEKKYPEYNVDMHRPVIFRIALILSLGFVIAAFTSRTYYQASELTPTEVEFENNFQVTPVTTRLENKRMPVDKPAKKQPTLNPVIEITDTEPEPTEAEEPNQPEDDPDDSNADQFFSEPEEVDDTTTFIVVQEDPVFPGGEAKLKAFLASIPYPPDARRVGLEGIVYVRFVVSKTGKVIRVEVLKGAHKWLDEAAVQHIANKMPDWIPGKQRGKPVNVAIAVPIKFTLE